MTSLYPMTPLLRPDRFHQWRAMMKILRRIRTTGSLGRTVRTTDGIDRAPLDPYNVHPISRSDGINLGHIWDGILPAFETATTADRLEFARTAIAELSADERAQLLASGPAQTAAPYGWRRVANGAMVTDARCAARDGGSM